MRQSTKNLNSPYNCTQRQEEDFWDDEGLPKLLSKKEIYLKTKKTSDET